jgi:outer membrane lipoprotein carrier protein
MAAAALLALALAAPAAAPDPQEVARRVQAFYEKTRDLEAGFVQTYSYAAFGRKQVSKGTLRVKKPGMLRWDYAEPARKTIAITGSRLVQWEPEAHQAYVDDRFDATAMSAAVTFLLGKGSLAKEFELSLGDDGWLRCTPKKPDPRVESIALEVGEGGEVTATRVRDAQGNVNEIRLSGTRRNAGLPDSAFQVEIPKDARRLAAPGK